jgi:hypothetical protein
MKDHARGAERKSRLPDAARSDERNHCTLADGARQLVNLVFAPNEGIRF